jgi:hypothetical protein
MGFTRRDVGADLEHRLQGDEAPEKGPLDPPPR